MIATIEAQVTLMVQRSTRKYEVTKDYEYEGADVMKHTVGKSLHDANDDYGNSSDVEDKEAAYANTDEDDQVEEDE
uniref:Prothymosin alpha n=1 Tax=Mesocestoides corti TaxID=53468 RepID=A0A5K3EZE2_MESCO